jgi:hypothetical protein
MLKSVLLVLFSGSALAVAAQSTPNPMQLGLAIARHDVSAADPLKPLATATRLVRQLDQEYYHGAWADTLRTTYSRFTPANNARSVLQEQAKFSAGILFQSTSLTRATINADEQTTRDTTYTYSAGGATTPTTNQTYSYNAQGQLMQTVQQQRVGNAWRDYFRTSYTYNAAGQPAGWLNESDYSGTGLTNTSQVTLTYNAQGLVTLYDYQYWSATANSFDPDYKSQYTYDAAGHLLTQQSQHYLFGAFRDFVRAFFTYNPAGQLQTVNSDYFNGAAWQADALEQYGYDADGNRTQYVRQRPTSPATPTTYANEYRILYAYERITATQRAQNAAVGLAVAPNPGSAAAAALYYQLPVAALVSVEVCDLLGRRVATARALENQAAGAHRVALAGVVLAPGLYMVRLRAGQQQWQAKWDNH